MSSNEIPTAETAAELDGGLGSLSLARQTLFEWILANEARRRNAAASARFQRRKAGGKHTADTPALLPASEI